MLVYKDVRQLLYVLASFYQPQNSFCVAVDSNSNSVFKKQIQTLTKCFPNIFYHEARKVSYCGFGVTNAVVSCLKLLSNQKNPWKYYQYLSGVDLPLKTNLEMVRIFKVLNGTFNAEVTKVESYRYETVYGTPPLPLWKSSLSATFSRESADYIAKSQQVNNLLQYLRKTQCSDESLWGTLGGQPEHFAIPGGFSAIQFYDRIMNELYGPPKKFQVWDTKDELGTGLVCNGSFVKKSCVYGIGDLPNLLSRPELVAHKFYIDLHPAAFFCFYERIRLRSLDIGLQSGFNAEIYSNLPQVQLSRGKNISEVNFFF